ncbi:SH3 domain-containing protein [Pontiella sulfatireligans]|uniref:SH3b domain-containing protein n=1 Tax=Pontiella sulfatireligans TaxID=2750658 RepID=A0A6C2UQ93_9BACT|nr:SH3 domain-containing protein [Pontiella sulfatireligans]VGO21477.1 hypothetical protein SCARR_03551 [Pontiella sulfatireligans]
MKLMLTILLAATALSISAETNELAKVRVTGDRVNLRTKPDLNSESLEPAMRGEELVFLGATNGWVAVQPPDYLYGWVATNYLKEGVVTPKKLNVRAGPSLNYTVLSVVKRGDELAVNGEFSGWFKVAVPVGSRVWISEDYVEPVEPPPPVSAPVVEPEPEPELEPVAVEPEPEPVEELPPLLLVQDKSRIQGVKEEIPGILRRANPGLYKLVLISGGIEEPICLVRGREKQMESHLNRSLLIKGRVYWAKDVDLPVIIPEVIHLDPIVQE